MGRLGGLKIGTFFDIPVFIHPTWLIILFLFTYSQGYSLIADTGIAAGAGYFIALISSIVIFATLIAHEYGHALAARSFGIGTDRITLFMFGGVALMKDEARRPWEEFVIAIAGPLVSLACMVLFGVLAGIGSLMNASAVLVLPLTTIAFVNLIFAVFNMLPGFPMDGGRVLRSIVWGITGNYLTSTRVAFFGGVAVGMLLIVMGFSIMLAGAVNGLITVMLGFFLWFLSYTALRQAQMKTAFSRLTVGQLMRPVQAVVPADATLRTVVNDYINRIHADRFPVVDGNQLLGYISADDISLVPREEWMKLTARRLAQPYRESDFLNPQLEAIQAYQRMQQHGRVSYPVFHGRTLVGQLFLNDISHHIGRVISRKA